jgi:hypothetical protein
MSLSGAGVRGNSKLRILRVLVHKKAIDQWRDPRFGGGISSKATFLDLSKIKGSPKYLV